MNWTTFTIKVREGMSHPVLRHGMLFAWLFIAAFAQMMVATIIILMFICVLFGIFISSVYLRPAETFLFMTYFINNLYLFFIILVYGGALYGFLRQRGRSNHLPFAWHAVPIPWD